MSMNSKTTALGLKKMGGQTTPASLPRKAPPMKPAMKVTGPKMPSAGSNEQSKAYGKAMKGAHEGTYGKLPPMMKKTPLSPKTRMGSLTDKNDSYFKSKVLKKYMGTVK